MKARQGTTKDEIKQEFSAFGEIFGLKVIESDFVYASVLYAKKVGNASRRAVSGTWSDKIISVDFDLSSNNRD